MKLRSLFTVFFTVLITLQTTIVCAHAVVTESSLVTRPVAPLTATSVVLTFNSNVELLLSKVFLVSKGDVEKLVSMNPGKKPGQIIIQLPPLVEGEYALHYKVFAADGHLTEDIIRFSVDTNR